MKCDQDLCLNFCYDLEKLLWQDELNPRVRCAFGNVFIVLFVYSASFLVIRDCNFVVLLTCEHGLMSSSDWEGGPGRLT